MDPLATSEVSRLEALGAGEPGARAFAALAEAHRRAGRPEEARKVAEEGLGEQPAHLAGRVALALALIDLGELEGAKLELCTVLDAEPDHPTARAALADCGETAADPLAGLDEGELEDAFAEAEARAEEMLTANHVAEAALRAVEDDGPEGVRVGPGSPFANETVATLLEEQGHADSARAIRAALGGQRRGAASETHRERAIETLERWLDRLRGATQ